MTRRAPLFVCLSAWMFAVSACARDWSFLETRELGSAGANAGGSSAVLGGFGANDLEPSGGSNLGGSSASTVGGGAAWPAFPPGSQRIAVGSKHVCAIRDRDRATYCFGDNDLAQRGNGTQGALGARLLEASVTQESDVEAALTHASALVSGANHVCALRGQAVLCWGDNSYGQVGDSENVSIVRARTVFLARESNASLFAGGQNTCALVRPTQTWCWGRNSFGEFNAELANEGGAQSDGGIESVTPEPELARWPALRHLSLGSGFAVGIVLPNRSNADMGRVHCWGRDDHGQCGDAPNKDRCPDGSLRCLNRPYPVPGVPDARAVYARDMHACAITFDEQVVCWGHNEGRQARPDEWCGPVACANPFSCCIGAGRVPNLNEAGRRVTRLALGKAHTCALIEGKVSCWGSSAVTGDVIGANEHGPVLVRQEDQSVLSGVLDIAAYDNLTCAITETDDIYCWGLGFDQHWIRAHHLLWQ